MSMQPKIWKHLKHHRHIQVVKTLVPQPFTGETYGLRWSAIFQICTAPKEANFDPEGLQKQLESLIPPGIKPESVDPFRLTDQYLYLGALYFRDPIGTMRRTHEWTIGDTSTYPLPKNVSREEVFELTAKVVIRLYPTADLAAKATESNLIDMIPRLQLEKLMTR